MNILDGRNEFGMRQDDFESLKLYDLNSRITDIVGKKIKHIFEKLFKNMGANSDDFLFMCFHSDNPNAFFINKDQKDSKLSKHIIAVSDSMIQRLDHEEELAAVIAHECGHFIWQKYTQDNNTIVQERWSDVQSVDLMINAGYNPLYILEMQEKIFLNIKYDSIDFGVHGTAFARTEDVKAYLTKKAMERGDFKKTTKGKSKDWSDYQKKVEKIYQEDGYNTYIDKLLIDKFGTKDLTKINRLDFLKLILKTVKSYLISGLTEVRINDLTQKFKELNFQTKTEEETLLLQDIFLSLEQTASIQAMYKLLTESHLGFFGPFQEQYENIENFMKHTDNREDAIMYAKKILDLKWTGYFTGALVGKYPQFTANGPDNIGKPLAYKKLESYRDTDINNALYILIENYDCDFDYNPKDYYLKDGIVVLYGEDAHKQYDKDEEDEHRKKDEIILHNNTKSVHKCIDYLNKLTDYATGKISAADILNDTGILTWFSTPHMQTFSYDVYIPEMKQLQETLLQSRGYDYFIRGNDNPIDNPNIRENNYSEINVYTNKIRNFVPDYDLFYSRYYYIMFRLAKDLIQENKLSQANIQIYYDNIISKGYTDLQKQYTRQLLHLFSTTPDFIHYQTPGLVFENFQYNEESICLKNIIKQILGKDKIKTSDELLKVIKNLEGKEYSVLMWGEFLRHGGRADPIKVIEALNPQNSFFIIPNSHSTQNVMSDILAKFITDEDFNSLTLYDQISLYEFLDKYKFFSDKYANQNKYIKIIVDQIVSSPVTDDTAVEYARKLLTRNPITRYGAQKDSDLQFFNEREKLIDFYSDVWAHKLGRDDNSVEYTQQIHSFVKKLETPDTYFTNAMSDTIKKSILDKVSNKVISQEKAAEAMGVAATIDVASLAKHDKALRIAEAAFGALAHRQDAVIVMINFLSNKLTEKSLDDTLNVFSNKNLNNNNIKNPINRTNLMLIHENFWGADLPIRAYLMNRLLNSYSEHDDDKLKLVTDMYFDKKSEYRKDAELVIKAVYNNLEPYERNLIIAALASAGQKGESDNVSGGRMVGRGLKMFLQNKGPAFIKFGQLLSYLPTLDSDIRSELATLRDKANIPTRDELFNIIKTALPESEIKKISYVGKLLGAGSFYITVQVIYNGRPCVLSVMRPFAHNLTQDGIKMIAGTIEDLIKADKKYLPLQNILNQARESAMSELDIEQDYQKYKNAKLMYEKFQVTAGDATYTPDVAQWFAYGASENGSNAYKIMEMADGHSLAYNEWTTEEKHDFAVAYVTLELALLLSGQKWDTDRHQGQQNFYNSDFRNFCIGIFDTAAQMNTAPTTTDKIMLGHLMYELAVSAKNGKSIGDALVKIIKNLDDTAKKFNIDTAYIDGVQRGLTALSDIIEYQKEQKDEYGNIIQESKSLTSTDFEHIISAIYDSGVIDNTVEKTVITKAILSKLMLWKSGLKLRGSISSDQDTNTPDIALKYDDIDVAVDTATKFTKAQEEIEARLAEQQKQLPIGIRETKDILTSSFAIT